MSNDVQVVEIGDSNALVPNLTISVDNEQDDPAVPQIEYEQEQNVVADEKSNETPTQIKPRLNLFPRKKIYENKVFGASAALGLSFEEAAAKRKQRAQRFQSPLIRSAAEDKKSDDPDILLAKSTRYADAISKFNKVHSIDDMEFIRMDSLHLVGVNSMSTDDIFAYFGKTNPHHIEWVNDTSCNVVWSEPKNSRIAMEKVAFPHDYDEAKHTEAKSATVHETTFDDDLDLEDEEMMENVEKMTVESTEVEEVPLNPIRKCREPFVKDKKKSFLEVRYATMEDRKELFAARKSKYYMQHGNPHYGGTRGLLSSTFRKRYQMKSARREFDRLKGGRHSDEEIVEDDEEDRIEMQKEDDSLIKSSVRDLDGCSDSEASDDDGRYGTMVADQVSQKLKDVSRNLSSVDGLRVTTSNTKIHSRLGKRRHEESRYDEGKVLGRLRTDLRNRLGKKTAENPKKQHGFRSDKLDGKRKDTREGSRKLTRYSPPPWE